VPALLALGCASPIPQAVREPLATPVGIDQVRAAPERYLGTRVRWGGAVIAVDNAPRVTDVEILGRPLGRDGEPLAGADPQGRFLARFSGFVDPTELPADRDLTVVGTLVGSETRPIGEYPYAYPVVQAESRYLWPEAPPPGYPAYPGYPWYGPWYDPFWGPYWGPTWGPFGGPAGRLRGGAWLY
jgi:outer membrane lipoprotein